MSFAQFLQRFGPALIMLLAALVYAGAVIFQHSWPAAPASASVTPEPFRQRLAEFKLPVPRPVQAECDALPHYTPSISVPVFGKITHISSDHRVLTVTGENSSRALTLASTTHIVGLGRPKPSADNAAETRAFNEKARACNDGTRVYLAPDPLQEITLKPSDLKVGTAVQVFMDETIDGGKTHAAYVQLMMPLKQ